MLSPVLAVACLLALGSAERLVVAPRGRRAPHDRRVVKSAAVLLAAASFPDVRAREDSGAERSRIAQFDISGDGGSEFLAGSGRRKKGFDEELEEIAKEVAKDRKRLFGIRVDPPSSDMHVDVDGGHGSAHDLASIRAAGERFIKDGMSQAAAEVYWRGVRAVARESAELLSDRAEAHIQEGLWAGAVRDAAAAILLDPSCTKSWQRYEVAAKGLGFDDIEGRARAVRSEGPALVPAVASTRAVLREALLDLVRSPVVAGQLPQDGAAEAARLSLALSASEVAGEVAAALSDLALCAHRRGASHDAIAAAAASLALRPSTQAARHLGIALVSLGELELAEDLLGALGATLPGEDASLASLRDVARRLAAVREVLDRRGVLDPVSLASGGFVLDWCDSDALEVVDMGSKGRGIRATRDIGRGDIIMVQRPRAFFSGPDRGKGPIELLDEKSKMTGTAGQAKLTALLSSAVASDALLASIVGALYDGGDAVQSVVPLETMLDVLNARVLPLLSQHPDFFPPQERVVPSSAEVAGVISMNSHSLSDGSRKDTQLFPAVSLLNHDKTPNCANAALHGTPMWATFVVAVRPIAAGTELTIRYAADEAQVQRHWMANG